jgi:UDP-N-acetylglucosamine 2-epimerase
VELVEAGWNKIAGLEPEKIVEKVKEMLNINLADLPYPDLYGSGHAGLKIVSELLKWRNNNG